MFFFFLCCFFFFKQKTAYEMRISDWSSDVCSSDLLGLNTAEALLKVEPFEGADRHRVLQSNRCHPENRVTERNSWRGGNCPALDHERWKADRSRMNGHQES